MTKQEALDRIAEILEIDRTQALEFVELAEVESWNSLSVLAFIAFADEELGLAIKPKALADAKKVGDLLGVLAEKLEG